MFITDHYFFFEITTKRPLITTVFLISLSLLFSCSSSNILLQPDYSQKNIGKGSLAVLILDDNPEIDYAGNLKPEFGEGDPHKLIMNFFIKQIPLDINEVTKLEHVEVVSEGPEQEVGYETREIKVWKKGFLFKIKKKVNVSIPSQGSKFRFSGLEPRYVLLIDELKIVTTFHHSSPMTGANGVMMGGGTSKTLNFISNFCIWDNDKTELISYGHLERSAHSPFNIVTMTTWTDVSNSYVRGIFWKSPFKLKSINF